MVARYACLSLIRYHLCSLPSLEASIHKVIAHPFYRPVSGVQEVTFCNPAMQNINWTLDRNTERFRKIIYDVS
jgi:hypothetical protein